jgi:hypothetical protein
MNWFKYAKETPVILPRSCNSYGEATVFINGKEYHYINVPCNAIWDKLKFMIAKRNFAAAFRVIKSLTLDPDFHKPKEEKPKQPNLFR